MVAEFNKLRLVDCLVYGLQDRVCADQSVLVLFPSASGHTYGKMTGRVRGGKTGANTSCCDGPKMVRLQLSSQV